jgi:magnesium-transporting ATPase (P-type)
MKIISLLSVIGIISSFFFFYTFNFLGLTGPSHYPFLVTTITLSSFTCSYIFNLIDVKSRISYFIIMLVITVGLVTSGMYFILSFLSKVSYPTLYGISGCYIEFPLFLILLYKWNKKK